MQTIKIPVKFRDSWFATNFGQEIQAKFETLDISIDIDFSKCVWIDPIPMLGLLCHLKKWSRTVKEKSPTLVLDFGGAGVGLVQGDSPSRARQYLVEHGFIGEIAKICQFATFKYESTLDGYPTEFRAKENYQLLDAIRRTKQCELYYGFVAACAPTAIESDANLTDIGQFVDGIVQMVDDKIFRGRRSEFQYRDSALVRLRQVSTEIINNSCEHAYAKDHVGPVYAYARLRQSGDHARDKLLRSDVETSGEAPLISVIHEVTGDRYLEFFVCDIGKGLVSDASDWVEAATDATAKIALGKLNKRPWPLRQLLSLICRLPVSKHKRNAKQGDAFRSNVTGLIHVDTVLSQHSDRSRIFVSPEWTADQHPRPENYNGGLRDPSFATTPNIGNPVKGTFFHFAIDFSKIAIAIDLPSHWLSPGNSPEDFGNLRPLFRPAELGIIATKNRVFDLRTFKDADAKSGFTTDAQVNELWKDTLQDIASIECVRMSRDFRKNLTDGMIEKWVDAAVKKAVPATLAFCDLSLAQAILLADHIKKIELLKTQSIEVWQPINIFIVSEELAACVFILFEKPEIQKLIFSERFPPSSHELAPILLAVRNHDTQAFWDRVSTISEDSRLLVKDVYWSQPNAGPIDIKLPIYLNYSLAIQDRVLAKILRRSLRRALAAFSDLNAVGIDDLVVPDLEDARRWMAAVEPVGKANQRLFVISSVVTGSTVERAEKVRGKPGAVLACFFVETTPPQAHPANYYSALDWQPIPNPKSQNNSEPAWERVPGTPFVRQFVFGTGDTDKKSRYLLVRPIPRVLADRNHLETTRPSAAQSYEEWHRDRLLRIGHWRIGKRHGLIEIDHTRALQISAESRQGFYNWLIAELTRRTLGSDTPLLVYPASRHNASVIRHLAKMEAALERGKLRWQSLPISYLPDIGDGLLQIAPLTSEQIRFSNAAAKKSGAIFFDIGFVGNRTFRNTKRQLLALGLSKVTGIGLVNRTSFPALINEMSEEEEDVVCYWRIDIPTLNDERSCPICKARHLLLTLKERARTFQPALVETIDTIRMDWKLSDPSQSWWDHGLEPILFSKPQRKKFGFQKPDQTPIQEREVDHTGQLTFFSKTDKTIPIEPIVQHSWPSNEVDWRYIWLKSSTQAAAFGIEISRTQSAPDYPWRLAKQIAQDIKNSPIPGELKNAFPSSTAIAIEIAASHLVLCSSDMSVASRQEGAALILQHLFELEAATVNESDDQIAVSLARLRGLVALTFANLDQTTKRLLLGSLVEGISAVRLVNKETLVALMALLDNSSEEIGLDESTGAVFDQLVRQKFDELNNSVSSSTPQGSAKLLSSNYRLITLTEQSLQDQFNGALKFFGAREHHGEFVKLLSDSAGELLNNYDSVKSGANSPDSNAGGSLLRSAILMAHSLICQGWRSRPHDTDGQATVGELFGALCKLNTALPAELLQCDSVAANSDRAATTKIATEKLITIRDAFFNSMIRIDPSPDGDLCAAPFIQAIHSLLTEGSEARVPLHNKDFKIHTQCLGFNPPLKMRYVLVGTELSNLIKKLKSDSFQHSPETAVAAPTTFAGSPMGTAHLWIAIEGDCDGGLSLSFWNHGDESARNSDFEGNASMLAPIHSTLGTTIERIPPRSASTAKWFCSKITFKWLPGNAS